MTAKLARPSVSPTGLTIWPLPSPGDAGGRLSLVWPGPGSRLYLGLDATRPGGSLVPIDHPTASGQYATRKDAARAAAAFVAAGSAE
jgi:hypothetical protein